MSVINGIDGIWEDMKEWTLRRDTPTHRIVVVVRTQSASFQIITELILFFIYFFHNLFHPSGKNKRRDLFGKWKKVKRFPFFFLLILISRLSIPMIVCFIIKINYSVVVFLLFPQWNKTPEKLKKKKKSSEVVFFSTGPSPRWNTNIPASHHSCLGHLPAVCVRCGWI